MQVRELIRLLTYCDADARVMVQGNDWGFADIGVLGANEVVLDVYNGNFEGPHASHSDPEARSRLNNGAEKLKVVTLSRETAFERPINHD